MRKRTIILTVILAALALTVAARASLFALGRVSTENVISYGSLKMELKQTDGTNDVPLTGAPVLRLTATPSQGVKRVITVKNVCGQDMYVRMRLSIGGTAADGETFALSEDEVTYAANENGGWQARPAEDGWYYYTAALRPGETTQPLLRGDEIVFHTEAIARAYPSEPVSLSVEVQAVQSAHNPEDGSGVFAAQGWPEEVKGS